MKELQKLLHALNSATTILLAAENDEDIEASVQKGMGLIGRCVDADRVLMWRNETIGGELYYGLVREWISDVGRKNLPVVAGSKFPYSATPRWEHLFSQGDYLNSLVADLPPDEQKVFVPYGIKSAVVIPLFQQNQFKGLLSLDDCVNERVLAEEEISVLRSAGVLFAHALLHHKLQVSISAQEALERFEIVWANVECGITVVDAETRQIIDINPVAARMFGRDKEDIIGHRCHKFVCPAEECSCPIIDKNQVVDRSERKFIRADGTVIPIIKSVAKIVRNGRLALLESFTDISSLKEAEKQLLQMQVTEQANKAKSYFLSTMSHEMRTPMNAIIGMTAIGKSASDAARKDYALENIENASKHLLGIINDVLDMSKIEAGKFELSAEEFSFEKMLQRVVNVVSFRVNEKRQTFTVYSDKNIPPVLMGDDQRLAQIITNLLGNAVKFTPAGGAVRLNARLMGEEDGVCTIQVEITDSGIGISPEQQARLFQSFQQAENNTTRKFGGTGLGLSISRSIVDMMGGRIWVESELNRGATFAFTIPMRRGDTQKYELLARETDWRNVRVLAVDENAGILGYLKNFVEDFGARCDIAESGRDAMCLARDNAYDLCFIDWKLPDIDGLRLATELKAVASDRRQHIVMTLAAVEWHDIEDRAKAAGVDTILPKPLFPTAIANIVNAFLGVASMPVDESPTDTVTFEGHRILLAEDVEINREIVQALLEPTRLTIDFAVNGVEAVRMFQQSPERYDAILMDVQMPEMDGHEATRRIRAHGSARAREIPIIAMTANVFREDVARCLEAGMNDHLGKPLEIDEVLKKLRHYLCREETVRLLDY